MYSAVAMNWLQIRPQPQRWVYEIGSYLPEAHNRIVDSFLKTDADRLLILEDDLAVRTGIIARCAGHRADIVSGLYVGRRPPHQPLLYEGADAEGRAADIQPDTVARLLEKPPGEYPISACGTGIMSIRRKVLETMKWPWFEPSPGDRGNRAFGGHDLYFCGKATSLGFKIAFDSSELMYGLHVGWQHYSIEDWIRTVRSSAGLPVGL